MFDPLGAKVTRRGDAGGAGSDAAGQGAAGERGRGPSGSSSRERLHLLLVEDNPGDARLIQELLVEGGLRFDLTRVARLSEARDLLDHNTYHLALVDLSLPDSSGLDTFAGVHIAAPRMPIVVLTGLDDDAVATQAIRAGTQDYLVKSDLDSELLVRGVRYAIERQRLISELEEQSLALRDREEHLRRITDTTADGILIVNSQGDVAFANPAAESILGKTRDELIGRKPDFAIDSPGVEEIRLAPADGVRFAEIQIVETDWDGQPALLAALRDISERKSAEEALRHRAEQQALVAELSNLALTDPDPQRLARAALERGVSTLEAQAGEVLILDKISGAFEVVSAVGLVDQAEGNLRAADDLYGYVMTHGPVVVEDIAVESRFSLPKRLEQSRVRCGLAAPIFAGGQPVGVVAFYGTDRLESGEDDGHFVHSVANLISTATVRHRAQDQMQLLQEAALEIGTAEDTETALEIMLRTVGKAAGFPFGQGWLPHPVASTMLPTGRWEATGPHFAPLIEASIAAAEEQAPGYPEEVFRLRAPVKVDDFATAPRFRRAEAAHACGLKSWLGVPVMAGDDVVAVLEFFHTRPDAVDDSLVELVTTVARQLAAVIQHRKVLGERDRLFKISVDMISILTPDGRMQQVNPAWVSTLGWEELALIGRDVGEFVHPEDRELVSNELGNLAEGGIADFECRMRNSDGRHRWFRWSASRAAREDLVFAAIRDTTEQRSALQTAERRAAELASVVDSIPDPVFIGDRTGIVTMNRPALEFLALSSAEEVRYRADALTRYLSLREIETGRLLEPRDTVWAAALEGRTRTAEVAITSPTTGEEMIVRMAGGPIRYEDDVVGAVVIASDITAQRKTEAALREADQRALREYVVLLDRLAELARRFGTADRLGAVYETLHSFVRDSGPFHRIDIRLARAVLHADQKLESAELHTVYAVEEPHTGQDRSDAGAARPAARSPRAPSARRSVRRQSESSGADEAMRTGEVRVGGDEGQRYAAVPLAVMGRTLGVMEVGSIDPAAFSQEQVTALRMAGVLAAMAIENAQLLESERAARLETLASEQRLQRVIDTVPEGTIMIGDDMRLLLANPTGLELLPALTEARVGDVIEWMAGEPLERLLSTAADGAWLELALPGEGRVLELAVRRVASETGGWVVVFRDVTEERERQAFLQSQQRLATVGQLAAGIAHDFNNILAVITLYAENLSRNPDSANRDRYIRTISDQAQNAASLVAQVLDFGRRSVMDRRHVNIATFIGDIAELLERTLPEHIRIYARESDEPCIVEADDARLQQAIINLAVNARDAMPGGGELRFEWEPVDVVDTDAPLPGMTPGRWVRLNVEDTGEGIQAGDLQRIFEPFYSTKSPGEGTGLGLAQVYGIVKQHGGEIDVESRVGEGTTFSIFLPASDGELDAEAVTDDRRRVMRSETILVVEDDDMAREALQDILEATGHKVVAAANGQEALTILQRGEPPIDVVVSDMVMPVMSGATLYRLAREVRPDLSMILVTGYPVDSADQQLLEQEDLIWVQKPFTVDELEAALGRLRSDAD